jgi:hypothetical protein
MADASIHNNPQDPIEEIFEWFEVQVVDLNHNIILLMAALASKLEPIGDDRGSNSKIKLEGKSGRLRK